MPIIKLYVSTRIVVHVSRQKNIKDGQKSLRLPSYLGMEKERGRDLGYGDGRLPSLENIVNCRGKLLKARKNEIYWGHKPISIIKQYLKKTIV